MKLTPIACPSCGSPVHIESGQILTECPFCGQQLHVDDGSRHVEHTVVYDGSEDAGYLFEKGRMQAQRDAEWLKRFGDSSEGLSDRQGLNEPDDVATTIPAPKPKAVTLRGLVVVLVCLAIFAGLLLWLPSLLSHSQRLGTSVVTRVRTGPEMLSSFAHIGYDEVSNPEEWDYLVTAEDFYEYGTDSDYCVSRGRYVIANLTDEQTPEFEVIQDTDDGSNDAVTVGFVHLAPHEQIRATLPDDSETMLIPYKAGLWIGIRDIEDADDGND